MRAKAGIFFIICILFLAGPVAAVGSPDTIIVTNNTPWIIANNVDQSTITVTVTNTTPGYDGAVQGITVNLAVDPLYGTLSPTTVITNFSGQASSTFKVKTKSGAPEITATISNMTMSNLTIQNIDHDSAYYVDFTHPLSGTVASEQPFQVSITDRHGNPVDNRRGNHIISLHVTGPAPGDCGFVEASYARHISPILDENGNASVNIRLTSRTGDNNIAMDGYESIPNQLQWITAVAEGIPVSITHSVSPSGSPPTVPADGTSFFTIIYTVFDVYGNPTSNQSVLVNTTVPGEENTFQSNNLGQVTIKYGPRTTIGEIDITAISLANSTVTVTQKVKFKDTGAEIISLTANPDTIPSRDVPPSTSVSNLIATVADGSGNAVAGEMVNFTIESIAYDGTYNVTAEPMLMSSSAITDGYGQAVVQFIPGSFTTQGNPGFIASATGHCNVIATWNDTHKTVPVTWKNYPYLSVSTTVSPLDIGINQTVDITIAFSGDGWAIQPTPIDVVLCTDRSGSMLYDNPDRMHSVRVAAKAFVDRMSVSRDHLSLVTFGRNGYISRPGVNSGLSESQINNAYTYPKTYNAYATIDRPLIGGAFGFNLVKTALDEIVPDHGTPMRSAIYKSVNEIISNGSAGNKKAIVLLSDGDYNWYGDPLARGNGYSPGAYGATAYGDLTTAYMQFTVPDSSQQNMAIYAKNNNISIYTIAFANSITSGGKTTLQSLALTSDGKYYEASASNIEDIYREIADELKDTAGVNVTSTADFENINVTGVTMPGNQVYDYVYHPTSSTKIGWQNDTISVIDQSADWNADNKLDFTIGTIKVGQNWNATFRLKVKQSGMIDVFGKNSTVSFNGGTETLTLPQVYINVIPQLNITEITEKKITLVDLRVTEPGEITALLPVSWNSTYDGNKTLTEKVYYRIDSGPWVLFTTKIKDGYPNEPTLKEYVNYAQLDVRKLPPGNYQILVKAEAPDAAVAMAETGVKSVGGRGKTFIKLEAPPLEGILFDQNRRNPWGILQDWMI